MKCRNTFPPEALLLIRVFMQTVQNIEENGKCNYDPLIFNLSKWIKRSKFLESTLPFHQIWNKNCVLLKIPFKWQFLSEKLLPHLMESSQLYIIANYLPGQQRARSFQNYFFQNIFKSDKPLIYLENKSRSIQSQTDWEWSEAVYIFT